MTDQTNESTNSRKRPANDRPSGIFSPREVNPKASNVLDLEPLDAPSTTFGNAWSYLLDTEMNGDVDSWSLLPPSGIDGAKDNGTSPPTFDQLIAWTPMPVTDAIAEEPMDTSSDSMDDFSAPPTSQPSFASLSSLEGEESHNTQVAPVAVMLPPKHEQSAAPIQKQRTCLGRALQAALSLHSVGTPCNGINPSSPAKQQSPRDIGEILLRNRDAIKLLDSILACQCASDRDVILGCCLTLTKIISWYSAAMDTTNANLIMSLPILLGSYSLDAKAQRSVLARVVLSELHDRVKPLLSKLPRHCILVAASSKEGSGMRSGVEQQCALREQIRAAVVKAHNLFHS